MHRTQILDGRGCFELYRSPPPPARPVLSGNGPRGIGNNTPMPSVMTPSPIACVGGSLDAVDVDLLVIPWFEDEAADAVAGVDGATAGELARALARREFRGCPYELFLTPVVDRKWRARRIAV